MSYVLLRLKRRISIDIRTNIALSGLSNAHIRTAVKSSKREMKETTTSSAVRVTSILLEERYILIVFVDVAILIVDL